LGDLRSSNTYPIKSSNIYIFKLLIDYEENIPPVATCISKLVKKVISNGDINVPPISNSPGGFSTSSSSKIKNRVLTAEYIFGHLV
jgi:hypothetical protein